MEQSKRGMAILYVAIAAMLWSTAGLLIKWVPWHPIAIAGIRSGIAAVVMLIFLLFTQKKWPKKPDKYVWLASLNYVILVMLFVSANKMTTSANAILLQFTSPAWLLIIGAVFFKEKFDLKDIITVVVVFLGMILFFVGDINGGGFIGNILAIASGVSMALMILSLKKVKGYKPLEIIFWGNLLTFLVSIPFYAQVTFDSKGLTGILLLGIFQLGISYLFYTKGIEKISALEGILVPVVEPLLNPVWVLLGTGEKHTVYALFGGVVVLIAVIYHSMHEMRK